MSDDATPSTTRRDLLRLGLAGLGLGAVGAAGWLAVRGGEPHPEGEVLYDDGRFRASDPALVRYRESARLAAGLLRPRGLALAADGTLYLAGDRTVAVVDAGGRRKADWACAGEPRALAVAADGRVFAGLRDRIQVFSDGKAGEPWAPPAEHAVITGLAWHPAGDLYAADAGNRAVWRYRDGRLCGRLGGEGDAEFIVPSPYMDVQVGPDGLVWVANTGRFRLEAYDREDRRVRTWGVPGFAPEAFCGCCNPADFCLLPDGRFITSEKGIARVKRYAADGRFECLVVPPEALPGNPVGIDVAAAPDGSVLVLDPAARAVRRFSEVAA